MNISHESNLEENLKEASVDTKQFKKIISFRKENHQSSLELPMSWEARTCLHLLEEKKVSTSFLDGGLKKNTVNRCAQKLNDAIEEIRSTKVK